MPEPLPAVRVVVATRPLLGREIEAGAQNALVYKTPKSFAVLEDFGTPEERERQNTYDRVVWNVDSSSGAEIVDQKGMFDIVCKPLMEKAFTEGFSFTVFAYGQSGSGKTYTITGDRNNPEQWGLLPRVFDDVFIRSSTVDSDGFETVSMSLKMSMIDLYLGDACDLLTGKKRTRIKVSIIGNGKKEKAFFKNMSYAQPKNAEEMMDIYNKAIGFRIIRCTGLNSESSRSHSIVRLEIELMKENKTLIKKRDLSFIITIVDLAGSERFSKTGAANDAVMEKEGKAINSSLTFLNMVIEALAHNSNPNAKPKKVPYRSHPLTMVLRDSLGGNSYTTMIAAINPCHTNVDETIGTMNYADSVKKMRNPIVSSVKEEVGEVTKEEIEAQQRLMEEQRKEMEELKRLLDEALASKGVSAGPLDDSIPALVNISPDDLLSGNLMFGLSDGLNVIGSDMGQAKIKLSAAGILDEHAIIELKDGKLILTCKGRTHLNSELVPPGEERVLKHCDEIVVADCKYFYLKDPITLGEMRERGEEPPVPTFDMANNHLHQETTDQLREQLEREMEEKVKASNKQLEDEYNERLKKLEAEMGSMSDDLLISELNEEKMRLLREKALKEKRAKEQAEIEHMQKEAIHKALVESLPSIKEVNAVCATLGENLRCEAEIKAVSNMKGGFNSELYVRASNVETGENDLWTLDQFYNRYRRIKHIFDCTINERIIDKTIGNPFVNIEDPMKVFTIGYGYLALMPLCLPVSNSTIVSFAPDNIRIPSKTTGSLCISPVIEGELVDMPSSDWLEEGKEIEIGIVIKSIEQIPNEYNHGTMLEYQFYNRDPVVVNLEMELPHEKRYKQVFDAAFEEYLRTQHLVLKIFGHKQSWKEAMDNDVMNRTMSNSDFEDYSDEELDNEEDDSDNEENVNNILNDDVDGHSDWKKGLDDDEITVLQQWIHKDLLEMMTIDQRRKQARDINGRIANIKKQAIDPWKKDLKEKDVELLVNHLNELDTNERAEFIHRVTTEEKKKYCCC
eukprot:TRINITY_DN1883_c0_g1_i1.p1 TRINITY_DN1883_c0_g1~~TRINITY_DN1883_c0_g1_i1.p1  ORF type:complete len:1019 (-),score=314.61 TRINITY_DN1883_c0_g1_i1:48-3104(-)